jgi:UDP-N-acetylglucosamine 4,6-dehydratase/5-epimerase
VGIRPGEKLHEEMISAEDARRTMRQDDRYVVMPTLAEWGFMEPPGDSCPEGFSYTSDANDLWLSAAQLREMLAKLA